MKSLYAKANELLDRIKLAQETKLLITITALGMMAIGFFMLVSVFAIKYDYEALYHKQTLPQVNLEEIKDIYNINIHDTVQDIRKGTINAEDAGEVIRSALEILHTQWRDYEVAGQRSIGGLPYLANAWLSLFLPGYRLEHSDAYHRGLLSKVQRKMAEIDAGSTALVRSLASGHIPRDETINNLLLDIVSIDIDLSSLINAHLKDAIAQKHRNDRLFRTSIVMLFLLIGFIFFLSILVSVLITNHFKRLNHSLESTVDHKTRQLRELNASLEKRIDREIIASRKKDQVMFHQAKLASMGEMLQNIAHQWRQPLGALMMIIQSFETKFFAGKLDGAFVETRVEDAMLLAQNMSDTLEDFRTFFHPHKVHKCFDLGSAIHKSVDLTRYQFEREHIEIVVETSHPITICGYENELTQILLNLISNARDALILSDTQHKQIRIHTQEHSDHARIRVIDNGGGIKDDIMPKIFEPYFTTKHKSVGTGVGLYMAKELLEQHMGGSIHCKNIRHKMGIRGSALQACTMFTISIPKQREEAKNHEQKGL